MTIVRLASALTLVALSNAGAQAPTRYNVVIRGGAIYDGSGGKPIVGDVAPHQYATGMMHVFVNGAQVLASGEHTGAKPGRVVRGPGWKGKR